MGARSSQALLAVAGAGLGVLWFSVAPHVAVRHWTSDVTPQVGCRQMLSGSRQWRDPDAGQVGWIADDGRQRYC